MLVRTLTSIGIAAVVIPIFVFSDKLAFVIFVAALSFAGIYEMLHCLGYHKKATIAIPAYLFAVCSPIAIRFLVPSTAYYLGAFLAISFLYMFYLLALAVFEVHELRIQNVAEVFITTEYIVGGFSSLVLLRGQPKGEYIIILVLIGAWITDVFAYLTGRFFGKHKLIPSVSPKKTIEGAIGGVVFCSLCFILYGLITSLIFDSTPKYLSLAFAGIVVSIISQLGDLIASVIKRQHNIKDFGNILPGHGGILDRFDSIVAISPILLTIAVLPDAFKLFF